MTDSTFRNDLFAGKSVLVVGGTSGIGAGIADAFAALGAELAVTGATQQECDGSPHRAIAADVRDDAAMTRIIGDMARLDVLVNCAGIIRRGAEHDIETFEAVLAVNLAGTMRTCALARPKLAQTRGAIVNTASMLSFFGGGLVPGYSASKGGVAQLTKSLAIAYAKQGIRVNAIAPGWVDTPLTKSLREDPVRDAAILARTPLGRWAVPEDIGGTVVFLCSPAARFITGAVVPIDGGYLVA